MLKGIERFVKERLPKDCRAEFPYARGSEAIAFDTKVAAHQARGRRRWRRSGDARPR